MQKARCRSLPSEDGHRAPTALRTYGFKFYFTPIPGFFSTFLHSTSSLSVVDEYLALAHGRAQIHMKFHVHHITWESGPFWLIPFTYRAITFYGWSFQIIRLEISFVTKRPSCKKIRPNPATPRAQRLQALICTQFRLFPFRSPLLRESLRFLFLGVLRCFTSPGVSFYPYAFRVIFRSITRGGFPHSEIPGSKLVCSSPRLIAAYDVLHRLSTPSYPPYALRSLTLVRYTYCTTLRYLQYEIFKEQLPS